MENTVRTERIVGLDLLRIVSMLLVVVLHLLGRGGVLAAVKPLTVHSALAWAAESAAYCAVDCYALLTGYLLCRSRCRSGALIGLWMEVFCYSAGITALFAVFRGPVSLSRFLQSCLPVCFTQYWYFTAYFAVYCLAPFFNRLLRSLSPAAFRRLTGTLLILFSLLPTLLGADPFVTGKGYSFLWLAVLYFVGACLRTCPLRPRRSRVWLGGYALCAAALLVLHLAFSALSAGGPPRGSWLLTYPSPLVLGAAVCLFEACRNLEIRSRAVRNLVGYLAPVSFGVYLLHAHPFLFNRVLNEALVPLTALPVWEFALAIPGLALGIFAVCSLADRLRLRIFRLLRLPDLAAALGARLDAALPQA